MRLKPSPEKQLGSNDASGSQSNDASKGASEDGLDGLDGLAELAAAVQADESEARELDDELDLKTLAAVAGARAAIAQETDSSAVSLRRDVHAASLMRTEPLAPASSAASPQPAAPAQRPAALEPTVTEPAARELPARAPSSKVVPLLACLSIALGVLGFALGRSSNAPEHVAPSQPLVTANAPSAVPVLAAPPSAAVENSATVDSANANAPSAAKPTTQPLAPHAQSTKLVAPTPSATAETRDAPSSAPARTDAPSARVAPVPAATDTPVLAVRPSAASAEADDEGAAAEPETAFDKETEELAAAAAKGPVRSSNSASVDDLLDQALANPADRRVSAVAVEPAIPEAPSREEVTQAMAVLLPAIRGCAMGQTGIAAAGIVVRGDGRVASVELSGAPFAGTASGRCMEGVIRRARFSRFRQPTFRVRFPFAIQ